jgi:hypothetical protein
LTVRCGTDEQRRGGRRDGKRRLERLSGSVVQHVTRWALTQASVGFLPVATSSAVSQRLQRRRGPHAQQHEAVRARPSRPGRDVPLPTSPRRVPERSRLPSRSRNAALRTCPMGIGRPPIGKGALHPSSHDVVLTLFLDATCAPSSGDRQKGVWAFLGWLPQPARPLAPKDPQHTLLPTSPSGALGLAETLGRNAEGSWACARTADRSRSARDPRRGRVRTKKKKLEKNASPFPSATCPRVPRAVRALSKRTM